MPTAGCSHGQARGIRAIDRDPDQKARGDRIRKKAVSANGGINPPDTLSDQDFRDRYPGLPPKGWGDRAGNLATPDGLNWRSLTKGKSRTWIRVPH